MVNSILNNFNFFLKLYKLLLLLLLLDTASVATNCGIVPQVLPSTRTMLTNSAAAGMHPLIHPNSHNQLPNTTSHLHHTEMTSSIYVDINSAASISTPSTSLTNTACLSTALYPGNSITPNSQSHLLNSNPTTPLIQHSLHNNNNNANIQNVVTSTNINIHQSSHEQQLAAAATTSAVAAATASAAHRQQQQQLHQLHQLQQQKHHQLMLIQQQQQNHLQMEHHHLSNNPFHHHVLHSAQLVADSIGAFTQQ